MRRRERFVLCHMLFCRSLSLVECLRGAEVAVEPRTRNSDGDLAVELLSEVVPWYFGACVVSIYLSVGGAAR